MKYFYFLFLSDVQDYTNLFRDHPQTHVIPNMKLHIRFVMNKLKENSHHKKNAKE